jgi:multidrug resistance protein
LLGTTGFVIMLGVGPLILAPLSETFGRRPLYLTCFTIFSLLQIPSALTPNIETLIFVRTMAGFFGSVSIANGGGTISDMCGPGERASIFGWYLLGPLLGPTIGPLLGGVIVQRLGWRWIFWVLTIVCSVNTIAGWVFLRETYAPVILANRKKQMEKDLGVSNKYTYKGEDNRPMWRKLLHSLYRPLRILMQPIVLTMSIYQAIIFATTYSIYTNMQPIYQGEYGFNTEQVGLLYLAPGLGFLTSVWFLVPRIDTVWKKLAQKNGGKGRPEFRLPLANIGSTFIPIALFWFAWTVQFHVWWPITIAATYFYGIGQIMILNTTSNYYIDSFERYSASAIAGGSVFRSVIGGIVPLFAPGLFESLGYGWGISVFGFLALAISPAPLVFYYFGAKIREKFWIELD